MLGELFVKLAFSSEFEHEEDAFLVVEVTIQTENIRVPQILLYFNLTACLFLDLGLDDFGFIETFKSKDVLRFAFRADHIDPPKFAFSERSTNVKAGKVPFTCRARPVTA